MTPADLVRKHVPKEWLGEAVAVVQDRAREAGSTTAEKRQVAVAILMRILHVNETMARLLVQLAMLILKYEVPKKTLWIRSGHHGGVSVPPP